MILLSLAWSAAAFADFSGKVVAVKDGASGQPGGTDPGDPGRRRRVAES